MEDKFFIEADAMASQKIDETKSEDVPDKTPTPTPTPTPNPDADEEKIKINDGNDFKQIKSFFKNIKIPNPLKNNVSNPPENYIGSYRLFLCYKNNDITNKKCEPGKEICLKCIKKHKKCMD